METKNGKHKKMNESTLANAFRVMLKEMNNDKMTYLAFSKRNFHILVFVLAMGVIANVALVDLLIRAPTVVQKTNTLVFAVQFLLSTMAIVSGLWLFLRGINIITDK